MEALYITLKDKKPHKDKPKLDEFIEFRFRGTRDIGIVECYETEAYTDMFKNGTVATEDFVTYLEEDSTERRIIAREAIKRKHRKFRLKWVSVPEAMFNRMKEVAE